MLLYLKDQINLIQYLNLQRKEMKNVDKYQFNEDQVRIIKGVQFFVAFHTILKKHFTLKRLNITSETDATYNLEMREINILKKINHESIYKCHKMLKTKNNIYFIYDNLELQTLGQSMKKNMPFDTKLNVIKQLGSALLELYKNQIANLTINPHNILLLEQNKIKIINFGQAQDIPENTVFIKISPEFKLSADNYSPPELADRKAYLNSDCYSLGIIIKNLFSQEFCFKDKNKNGINSKKIDNLYLLANKLVTKVPEIRPTIKEAMHMLNRQDQDDDKSLNRSTKTFKSEDESKEQKQKSKNIIKSTKQDLNSHQFIQTSHSIKELSQKYITSSSKILTQTQDKIEQLTKTIYKKRKIAMVLLFMATACSVNKESKPFYIMRLSYLLVKKATIIISQLAKLLRTGKGFDILIGEKIKETFTKSKQFLKINPIINNEMHMTQQKFQDIVEDLKSLTEVQKDKKLKEELSSQKIDNGYLKKCASEFLHELHLSYNQEYLNEYDKSHLIGIYFISLLSSYDTYESAFEDLFSNNSSSFSSQLIVKQISNFCKETIIQFIELGIHDNYSKIETFTQNNLTKSNKSFF